MTIRAQSADGATHEFPDGTDQGVIDGAMKSYAQKAESDRPEGGGFLAGVGDFLASTPRGAVEGLSEGAQSVAELGENPGLKLLRQGAKMFGVKDKTLTENPLQAPIQDIERAATSRLPEPQGAAGRFGETGAEFLANPLSYAGPGGLPLKVGSALAAGVTSQTAGEVFRGNADLEPIAKAAGGVLGGVGTQAGVHALRSFLEREFPANIMTQAVDKILKRMAQDTKSGGPTATDALDLINNAAASGQPMTLADVGGENLRGLAGNVTRQPGESRNVATQFLNQRDEAAAGRLSGAIDRYVSGGQSMEKTADALMQARSASANPAYEKMRALDGIWSPRLQQFIDEPVVRTGLAKGYEIERLQSLAENRPFDPTQMGVDLDAQGNIKLLRTPNMRVLDMAKQGLDALVGAERNELTGRLSSRGVALDRVRRAYIDEIDGLDKAGVYKDARAAWAGPSASLDALRSGRSALTSSPDEITKEIRGLSPADQEFYRLGVADAIRERVAKTGLSGDEAKAIIKNNWMRRQLQPIFRTPQDFDAFANAVTNEQKMFGTKYEMLGNSATAKRLAEDQSGENLLAAGGAKIAENVATGHWLSAAKNAIRMYRDVGIRPNPKLNEQIAKILFGTPIDAQSEVGQRLTGQFVPQQPPRAGVFPTAAGNIAASLGAANPLAPGSASPLAGAGP